jgi:hypothetical protein
MSVTSLVMFMLGGWAEPSTAQGIEDPLYFENGCYVDEAFVDFFQERGGVEVFGYPISLPFHQNGVYVQYFQNARIESHPDHPDPYKIQLGLLGDELNYRNPPLDRPRILSPRRFYFPETGHIVSYAFLEFFREKGGIDTFGYPITEMHFEDGQIVQYFQRMKLEWYPDDSRAPVQIAPLGEIYFNVHKEHFGRQALCAQSTDPDARVAPLEIRVTVDVESAVMTTRGEQTVSVLVSDGDGMALEGASVTIYLRREAGDILGTVPGLETNAEGFVRVSIPVEDVERGNNVVVEAEVSYSGVMGTGDDVFLVWW